MERKKKAPQFHLRYAQFSDLVQINEIYNHYVETSPFIFVDDQSPIRLNEHVELWSEVLKSGSLFIVAVNPLNYNEVYGWHCQTPGTYRGALLDNLTVSMTFVRPDKRSMKIGDYIVANALDKLEAVPWFGGMIGESNVDNSVVSKNQNRFDIYTPDRIIHLKNIAVKFGKFTSMRVDLLPKEVMCRINEMTRHMFGEPRL